MPIRFPAYPPKPHSTGQARVKVNGDTIYLGKHNSPASRAEYAKLIAKLANGGEPLPDPDPPRGSKFTIFQLIHAHKQWAATRYVKNGKPTSEIKSFKMALQPVATMYGDLACDEFGPRALVLCRKKLIAKGYTRKRINQHVGRIRQVFKWGVSREMVSPATLVGLQSVTGLRAGEDGATDPAPVTCVADAHVLAVKPFVLPPIWAMIQLQCLTGMRPGEVCSIRTCDVHESDSRIPAELLGKCWVYRPASHKTEHHGKQRVVFLGPQSQALLTAWLRADAPDVPIFSAREAVEWARKGRRAKAKHPRRRYKVKEQPKRTPANHYTPHAYAHAIAVACKAADIDRWSPNQLRHNAGTLVRQKFGAEAAQVVLGHANLAVTEIYAERDLAAAAKAIAAVG